MAEEIVQDSRHRPVTRAAKRARTATDGKVSEHDLRRARTLVGEGATRKALDSLMSEGSHDPTDSGVLDRLRQLHPDGQSLSSTLPECHDPHIVPDNSEDGYWDALVREAVLRFPRASSPGPSGLRPSHL